MTKNEFLHYARNEMQGWCYCWIDRGEEGIGLHELYRFEDGLGWSAEPDPIIGGRDWLPEVLEEITRAFNDGLIFTEKELQCQ